LIVALGFGLAGCKDLLGGDTTTVTGVEVTPAAVSVPKGGTQVFTAVVQGTGTPPQSVLWSVAGNAAAGTVISNGTLIVAADETAAALTVRAASTQDTTKVGLAVVTVTARTGDTTAPAKVTGLSGTAGNARVTLSWTDPTDGDLDHIEITFSPVAAGVTQPISVLKGTGTGVITGLTNGTAYTFTVTAVDASGNKSGGETAGPYTPTVTVDTTPPGKVSGLETVRGNGEVRLAWSDPADGDLDHIEITFSPGAAGVTQPISVLKGTETRTITGLTNGTAYSFTVQAVDASGNKSGGETKTETPDSSAPSDITPPAKVSGLSGTTGNARVTLSWTDPTDGDLDHIEISFSPAAAGVTQPISVSKGTQTRVITGLTNGTAYTFTVKTVDVNGNKSGGETASHTPQAPDDPDGPDEPDGPDGPDGPEPTGPAGHVKVLFSRPYDEYISITGLNTSLSKPKNTQMTVSVSSYYTAYRWYLDGEQIPEETSNTLTLYAGSLDVKRYTLTVFVTTSGGVEYAKRLSFIVGE
jgi:hypothetical protein